jgi:hypothetical protein
MKTTVINVLIGMLVFYIGAEVGYQLAYDSVKCVDQPAAPPRKTVTI